MLRGLAADDHSTTTGVVHRSIVHIGLAAPLRQLAATLITLDERVLDGLLSLEIHCC